MTKANIIILSDETKSQKRRIQSFLETRLYWMGASPMTSEASDAESRDSHESGVCEDEFKQNEKSADQEPRVELFGIAGVSDCLDFRLFEFVNF